MLLPVPLSAEGLFFKGCAMRCVRDGVRKNYPKVNSLDLGREITTFARHACGRRARNVGRNTRDEVWTAEIESGLWIHSKGGCVRNVGKLDI